MSAGYIFVLFLFEWDRCLESERCFRFAFLCISAMLYLEEERGEALLSLCL